MEGERRKAAKAARIAKAPWRSPRGQSVSQATVGESVSQADDLDVAVCDVAPAHRAAVLSRVMSVSQAAGAAEVSDQATDEAVAGIALSESAAYPDTQQKHFEAREVSKATPPLPPPPLPPGAWYDSRSGMIQGKHIPYVGVSSKAPGVYLPPTSNAHAYSSDAPAREVSKDPLSYVAPTSKPSAYALSTATPASAHWKNCGFPSYGRPLSAAGGSTYERTAVGPFSEPEVGELYSETSACSSVETAGVAQTARAKELYAKLAGMSSASKSKSPDDERYASWLQVTGSFPQEASQRAGGPYPKGPARASKVDLYM
jgi:hypothetical protein